MDEITAEFAASPMTTAMEVPYVPAQRHFYDITGLMDEITAELAASSMCTAVKYCLIAPMDIFSQRSSVVGGRVQVVPHGWEALDLLCMGKARAQY